MDRWRVDARSAADVRPIECRGACGTVVDRSPEYDATVGLTRQTWARAQVEMRCWMPSTDLRR